VIPVYLADTSAWNRSNATEAIAERWAELVLSSQLAICPPVELELLYSAQSSAEYSALREELAGLPELALDERAAHRSRETQAALAARSQHRGPTPTDLLVASIAEIHGTTLLHYDRHFDVIAAATGQRTEWLARRGALA
jgi:predicted nucleic acid-binding protein